MSRIWLGTGGNVTRAREPARGIRGMKVSSPELREWRTRKASGPYRARGDVSANSPGDWERIESKARTWLAAPYAVWNEAFTGPWHPDVHGTPEMEAPNNDTMYFMDACLYAFIMKDRDARDTCWAWLISQSQQPYVDFTNTTLYDSDALLTGGNIDAWFSIQRWLAQLVFAYDYLVAFDAGTQAERDAIVAWLLAGAKWRAEPYDTRIGTSLWGTPGGDRATLTPRTDDGSGQWPYFDSAQKTHSEGHTNSTYQMSYNNRGLDIMLPVILAGLLADDDAAVALGVRYFQEYVQCAVYPDEDFGEMHRATTANEEVGYVYVYGSIHTYFNAADALWRVRGDTTLYEFTTRLGVHGTECGVGDADKSALVMALAIGKYGNDTFERYGNGSTTGDADRRIDSRSPRDGSSWRGHHDIWLAHANRYYQNTAIENAYLRNTAAGYPAFWSAPSDSGSWEGLANQTCPGVLFMYGQMEDVVPPGPMP